MNHEQLARRAVACKGWRWLPGMLTLAEALPPAMTFGWDPARVVTADPGAPTIVCTAFQTVREIHATALPDFRDSATLGCLIALVRLAWRCPLASTKFKGPDMQALFAPARGEGPLARQWQISLYDCANDRHVTFGGYSEAEALVAALEAAP